MALAIEVVGLDKLLVGLEEAPALLEEAQASAITRSTLIVESEVKARTPRVTGRLFSSIGRSVEVAPSGVVGRVGTSVIYARPVEFGTRPHDIVPRNKRALYWRGAAHPVTRVHHPGSAGRRMFREGLAAGIPAITAEFTTRIRAALAKIARR